jgi:transcription elongation factor Elf1
VKLAKRFKCPFCANDDTVECKMDFKINIGSLHCRLCGASYQMSIHHLHEPIDVFSEWLDDCEAAANPLSASTASAAAGTALLDEDDELPDSAGLKQRSSIDITKGKSGITMSNGRGAALNDLGLDDDSEIDDDD